MFIHAHPPSTSHPQHRSTAVQQHNKQIEYECEREEERMWNGGGQGMQHRAQVLLWSANEQAT